MSNTDTFGTTTDRRKQCGCNCSCRQETDPKEMCGHCQTGLHGFTPAIWNEIKCAVPWCHNLSDEDFIVCDPCAADHAEWALGIAAPEAAFDDWIKYLRETEVTA